MMADDLDLDTVRRLLQRIAKRDEAALYTLHRQYARKIYAFVIHRCGDAQMADVIVSETLFEVWNKPASFRGESKFSTWLLGVARYKMLSALRRPDRNHDDIEDHSEVLVSADPAPQEVIEKAQDAKDVQDCLKRLSAVQRECMHLVFYEDMTVEEIARLQDVPDGTVKTRLFHARKNMRECLQPRAG